MISNVTVERIDLLNFRIRWTSDEPVPPMPIRIFRDGVLVATWMNPTAAGEYVLFVPIGGDPFLEILDRPEQLPSQAAPGEITLHWFAVAGAVRYLVEQFVAGNWVELAQIPDDGSGSFRWLTPWLADGATYPFRITPIDAAGNSGTPTTRSIVQVRHPPTPEVAFAYDSGTAKITISG